MRAGNLIVRREVIDRWGDLAGEILAKTEDLVLAFERSSEGLSPAMVLDV